MTDAARQPPSLGSHDEHQHRCRRSIQAQSEISVSALVDGSVEIEEKSAMGADEDQRIFVSALNAVRLPRSILYVAGFNNVLIAADARGECVLDDNGAEPSISGDSRGR